MKSFAAAFLLVLVSNAGAQDFGKGGRDGYGRGVHWYSSIDRVANNSGMDEFERRRMMAFGMEPKDKKYIFIYIRPVTEDKEPNEFSNADIATASRQEWGFVKMDFDKENPFQKAWGVKTAPACVGADLFGNDFVKMGGASIDTIRSVMKNTPPAVNSYIVKLKSDYDKANDALKSDEERGAKLLVDICLAGKPGYKEVGDAQGKLNDITEKAFAKCEVAEAVSPEAGVEYLEELAKIYRITAPGARAEIRIAQLENHRGNSQAAIQRLLKVSKYDSRVVKGETDSATKVLDEISKAGEAKLDAAVTLGDKAQAKEVAKRVAKDYAGTEAGKKALELSK